MSSSDLSLSEHRISLLSVGRLLDVSFQTKLAFFDDMNVDINSYSIPINISKANHHNSHHQYEK